MTQLLETSPPTSAELEALLAPYRERATPQDDAWASTAAAVGAERARRARARRRRRRAASILRRIRDIAVAVVVGLVAGVLLYALASAGLVKVAQERGSTPASLVPAP